MKKVIERILPLSQANDDFDINFWQKAGTSMRFKAAWDMVKEYHKIRGKSEIKLRLQRSIQNIQQI